MARTHSMANRNFLRALNRLWRRFYIFRSVKDLVKETKSITINLGHFRAPPRYMNLVDLRVPDFFVNN